MSKYCAYCGAKLADGALFCHKCGRTAVKDEDDEDQGFQAWSFDSEQQAEEEKKPASKYGEEAEVDLFEEAGRQKADEAARHEVHAVNKQSAAYQDMRRDTHRSYDDNAWKEGETTWLDEQMGQDEDVKAYDRSGDTMRYDAYSTHDPSGTRQYTPLDQEKTRVFDPRYGESIDEFATQDFDPQDETIYIPDEEEPETYDHRRQEEQKKEPEKKKVDQRTIIILACCGGLVVILIILLIALMSCGKSGSAIDLNEYVTMTFEGTDGYGTAEAVFDQETFIIDHADDFVNKVYGSGSTDAEYFAEEYQNYMALSQTEGLSNGDTVTLTWDFDVDAVEEIYGVAVTAEAQSIEVSGLAEAGTVDPFSSLSVEFSGSDGYGEATLTQDDDDYASVFSFSADTTEGLSNGDTVTVTCTLSITEDEFVETYGLTLGDLTKEYEVSGLSEAGTVDPFDSVDVSFEGTDGYGEVVISVTDTTYGFTFAADVKSGLSNGDTVTVTCTLAESEDEFIKEYGLVPGDLTKEYTVSDLTDVETFDPFEYITVSYSGTSGEGVAAISVSSDAPDVMDQYYPTESTISGLSNGDTFTVTLLCHTTDEDVASTYAMTPSSLSKTYTVSGLETTKYVSAISDITSEELTTLKSEAAYAIEEDAEGLSSTTYLGLYVLSAYSSSASTKNRVYVVYEVTVTVDETSYTYVAAFEVKNLYSEDGTFHYDESSLVDKTVSLGGVSYKGFDSASSFETWLTNKYSSSFSMEDNL